MKFRDPIFVFFHIGEDVETPTMLVQSLRITNPSATILQCSDASTNVVPKVDSVFRGEVDSDYLMLGRLKLFSELKLLQPAFYLDTDMLVLRRLSPSKLLAEFSVAICLRQFDNHLIFTDQFKGLDFSEYRGQSLGTVFPYLACCSITPSFEFWERAVNLLAGLDEKYLRWYGDQEVIKILRNEIGSKVRLLPESFFGCLPEKISMVSESPGILHFKGKRKNSMKAVLNYIETKVELHRRNTTKVEGIAEK